MRIYCLYDLVKKEDAGIKRPKKGWKAHTWYRVLLSVRSNNPVFEGLLYTGFLNEEGEPSGYRAIISSTTPSKCYIEYNDVYYLKVVKKLFTL